MIKRPDTNAQRLKRHTRVRGNISGTSERPRLNVFRSANQHLCADHRRCEGLQPWFPLPPLEKGL